MCAPVVRRTIVYVDGFNFYYGVLKKTPYKWLDLQRFFTLLRPHDDLQAVKFFTSLLSPGPHRIRQDALLQALGTRPLIEVVHGRFKTKKVVCRCRDCPTRTPHAFEVPEEKRTDVNIAIHLLAIHLLDDAYAGRCDQQILVSGDSDLAPAVKMVRQRFPAIRTVVYIPARTHHRGAASELRGAAHKHDTLPLGSLSRSQLPPTIPDGVGGTIRKPAAW